MRTLKAELEIGGERYSIESFLQEWEQGRWEENYLNTIAAFLKEFLNETDRLEVWSSGSTGERKRISLSKEGMRKSARMTIRHYGIPDGSRALLCLSADYIAGKMMLVRAIEGGWTLKLIPPDRDPTAVLEPDERFAFAALVPLQVREALADHEKRKSFEALGQVIIGGAPLAYDTEKRIRSLSNPCAATYGMTETMTHIADRPLNGPHADDHFRPMEGVELEGDRRGCLLVRAPHLFEGEVRTNDLVEFQEDGRFHIRGRYDRLINSGAVKLLPEELESKLASVMDRRFFIDKEEDEELGEAAVLFLEGPPLDERTERLLFEHMREKLRPYEVPKRIIPVPAFEETGSGKIDRWSISRYST